MLSNVLLPPYCELPVKLDVPRFIVPGGGRLYVCDDRAEALLREAFSCDSLEGVQMRARQEDAEIDAWHAEPESSHLNAHIYGCADYNAFREICKSLAMERLGILQVSDDGKHCVLLLTGNGDARSMTAHLRPLAERLGVDIAVTNLPPTPRLSQPGCLFLDMDSTLIACECIDEIADFMGIKDRIATITRLAMEGELDFTASLLKRVGLLAGLDISVLQEVMDRRIVLTDGAEHLIETLHANHWKIGLVSGGFTYFAHRLQARLQLDFSQANTLERHGSKLTGRLVGNIVDARAKRALLLAKAAEWRIPITQTVAIGDGANDLLMLEAAALGIAYHAKPRVRELAPYSISYGGLDRVLDLLR